MTTDKRLSILHKKLIFYSIGFVLAVLGIYVAKIIEDNYKNVTGGIVGLALFYLIWITYVFPKNTTDKFTEFEELKFPKHLYYLLYGFFWTIIMYLAGSQILDLARYLLQESNIPPVSLRDVRFLWVRFLT